MRLTELVYDWAFNQIDPENLPKSDRTLPALHQYQYYTVSLDTGINIIATVNSTTVRTDVDPTSILSAGNILLTDEGRLIGTVQSTTTSPDFRIVFTSDIYHKDGGGTTYTGDILRRDDIQYSEVQGIGETTTFVKRNDRIHMTKGAIIGARNAYGTSGTRFHDLFSADFDTFDNSINTGTDVVIPVDIGEDLDAHDYPNNHTSRVFKHMATGGVGTNDDSLVNKAMMAINFNNYSIEDGINLEERIVTLVTLHCF